MNQSDKSIASALSALGQHGKSFRFAGHFLSRDQLEGSARLYRFCRFIDDLVDETLNSDTARAQLETFKKELKIGCSRHPVIQDFICLASDSRMQPKVISELIKGIESDLEPVIVEDTAQLLRYCYRVAGTVGLLMCDVLGVSEPRARVHAIDLGIGMQLTNIARDIREDALRGRRYIPAQWIGDISPQALTVPGNSHSSVIQTAVEKLLQLAEHYYDSGSEGLRFLPPRSKIAISIAAKVYREIGVVLGEQKYDPFLGRAHVTLPRKFRVALKLALSSRRSRTYVPHVQSLHLHLEDLPNAHASA